MINFVAVYGSLRKDMYNHPVMKQAGAEFQGMGRIRGTLRADPRDTYPFLTLGTIDPDNDTTVVEVYTVPDEGMEVLDILEGYPRYYNRTQVDVGGEGGVWAHVWVYHLEDAAGRTPVLDGNWVAHVKRSLKESWDG